MLMQHSDMPFPDECALFPSHEDIFEYTKRYASDVEHLIHYRTQVLNIRHHSRRIKGTGVDDKESKPVWSVTTRCLQPDQGMPNGSDASHSRDESSTEYDAVLIASGHYTVPFIPDYDGLREWSERNSGAVSHSKYFKVPEDYADKKVVVVGFGPSGVDISAQIAKYCKKPLLVSTRSPPMIPISAVGEAESLPGIESFVLSRSIRLTDGTIVHDIDHVLFCTGYLYSYPFLPPSPCAPVSEDYPLLPSRGNRVHNLYQHIFHTPDPTLAFMAIPWNIVPFPVSEAQAAVIARTWSGRLTVPSVSDMMKWEKDREAEKGAGKIFHKLPVKPHLEDADYINMLWSWVAEAQTQRSSDGTSIIGKEPPFWDERTRWMRENVSSIRMKFGKMRDSGKVPKTLEDVGFVWDDQRH
ncbi:MAG: hypothetical protein M1831_002413 [Alyxoria varia]|nr:MAG: hypothetical protein M1831_002413 [Alyxoria varia]